MIRRTHHLRLALLGNYAAFRDSQRIGMRAMEWRPRRKCGHVDQPRNGLIRSGCGSWQNCARDHGTARGWTVGQRRVTEKDIDSIEWNACLRVRDLGE